MWPFDKEKSNENRHYPRFDTVITSHPAKSETVVQNRTGFFEKKVYFDEGMC